MQGAAGMSLYDGREIAAKHGIVVVTINYRLGALGFLATGPETGNFGILDQRVAMQWVQRNIAAFGGNPDLVTLAGQSAGGVSVATHLVAPKSKGLFHRAIIESDPGSLRLKQASDQTVTANRFADAAGCGSASQMDCLRALSVDEVLSAQKASQGKLILDHILDVFLPWTPNVGGSEVPAEPLNGIDSGDWNAMPLMVRADAVGALCVACAVCGVVAPLAVCFCMACVLRVQRSRRACAISGAGTNALPPATRSTAWTQIGNTANDAWMFVMSAAKHLSPIEYRALALYLFGLKYEPDVLDRYPASSVFSSNDTRPELSILGTGACGHAPPMLPHPPSRCCRVAPPQGSADVTRASTTDTTTVGRTPGPAAHHLHLHARTHATNLRRSLPNQQTTCSRAPLAPSPSPPPSPTRGPTCFKPTTS